jgi:AraC family transcriptional regulator, dual regulator of chb operon
MKRIYELAQAKNQFEADAGISFHYFHAGITPHEKHFHDFYEVLIVIEGEMIHHINEKTMIMNKGDMMFLRPHDHHFFEKKESCNCVAINIPISDKTFLDTLSFIRFIEYSYLLFETLDPPKIKLDEKITENIIFEFKILDQIHKDNLKVYIAKLKCALSNMLTYFFMSIDDKVYIPEWFSHLCKEMHKKDNFIVGTSRMMELTDKTYQHIGRTFRKYLGTTPTHFVNHLRIRYGVNLIINTNLPTTEVIYECGFNNSSQFFKLFKELYNYTPKELKNDIMKFL